MSSNKKVMEILIFIPKFPFKVLCRHELRGCLPKILNPILDYVTDFLETLHEIYTLVG